MGLMGCRYLRLCRWRMREYELGFEDMRGEGKGNYVDQLSSGALPSSVPIQRTGVCL